MNKRNSAIILDERASKKQEMRSIVETAKQEARELTEEETNRIEELKEEIKKDEDELKELESKRNQEDPKDPEDPKDNKDERNKQDSKMKQNFSLLGAIRSIVNNHELDPIASAVVAAGKEEMRGMSISGQIQIPVEKRTVTVTGEAGEHDDVVSTDLFNVLEPLQHKLALAQAGARFITGLVGDVQFPLMSNGNVAWEGETTEADDLGTTFSSVKLQPKRLSATIEVSKQFIMQDSVGAENAIRNEMVNAIAQKLESTILGDAAGTATKPAGIFNGATDTASSFADICEMEAELEENKFTPAHYILSPSAKASLRSMQKGNGVGFVFENGEVDGVPATSTGLVTDKKVAVGDFSQYVIGQWGALDITVDPYTKAKNATVVLTINAWFDGKLLRENAIQCFSITE